MLELVSDATNGNTTIGTTNGSITFNQGYNNVLSGNALTFYNGGAASTIQGWFTNPGIGIGYTQTTTQPNPGTALAIRGTVTTSGSGVLFVTGSSTTKLLTIASETNSSILVVSGSGTVGISNTGVVNTALAITANGAGGGNYIVQGYDSGAVNRFLVTATGRLQMTGTTDTGTSGTDERVRLTNTFNPTSGTREHMGIYLVQAISQSGGANGITRGLYIQPTLTAAVDYRAIETTSGSILFQSGSVTSTNGFTGSLQGTASWATNALTASYALSSPSTTVYVANGNGTTAANSLSYTCYLGGTPVSILATTNTFGSAANAFMPGYPMAAAGTASGLIINMRTTGSATSAYKYYVSNFNTSTTGSVVTMAAGHAAGVYSGSVGQVTFNQGDALFFMISSTFVAGASASAQLTTATFKYTTN